VRLMCDFTTRRVSPLGLLDLGESTQRGDDLEALPVAQHAGHGDRSGELLEILG
jgi:hypothetical protein